MEQQYQQSRPLHYSFPQAREAGKHNNPRPRPLHLWSPFGLPKSDPEEQRHSGESEFNFGERLVSAKRQRAPQLHHVILSSSQDEDCHSIGDDNDSMMDCDSTDHTVGPNKRRCFGNAAAYPFAMNYARNLVEDPFNEGKRSPIVAGEGWGEVHDSHKESLPPMEWWKKKRPPFATPSSISQPIVEQEVPSSSMDTTFTNLSRDLCCHICQTSFPPPILASIKEIMPTNALLNYFTPVPKNQADGDVSMGMTASASVKTNKSPAACACCDRSACPDCRKECQICSKSFCSFCTISKDETSARYAKRPSQYCLDCYDHHFQR